ncbi:hypothetical protein [Flavisolibacter ginsenosidimutans]|uniref:Uncharacterized protein n=1 Tax=Flavisolibacter ginsenosidimutans TaxID=661481 RepID=A0A5B8UKX9_9BACT|nr:hypothetical protein [Flavisolibacter ginsenosidimutans]QEC56680.1 hypothetical protein FSB75_12495 [Flavisolibacter ginsenosidimutans]
MAKQKGIIKLEGTIGDITFFKSKDGYLARGHNPVSGARIATDPAFQRTRENGREFGRAGKAGKLLRSALRSLLQNTADSRMVSRLTTEMLKVVQADATSQRGERNVLDGETELLSGFEFNNDGKLSTTLLAPFSTSISRTEGTLTVDVPAFVPERMVAAPAGASHFKLVCAGASIDFETGEYVTDEKSSTELPVNSTPTAAIHFNCAVMPASTKPLFLLLGISFYQEVNGAHYPLKNGAYNALQIVGVAG